MPCLANILRTAQQNSHHSSANITTGCSRSPTTRVTNSSAACEIGWGVPPPGCGGGATSDRYFGHEPQLVVGHVRRDVAEKRSTQITLSRIRQHAHHGRTRRSFVTHL